MIDVLLWCGIMSAIGASLFVVALSIEAYESVSHKLWRTVLLNYNNTKAFIVFKRVQRRMQGKSK